MAESSGEIGHATGGAQGTSTDPAAAAPTSEELRSQIEQTRAEMSDTIDAIQARLSPRRLVTDAKDTVTEATVGRVKRLVQTSTRDRGYFGDVRSTVDGMVQTARNNPIPVAVAGLAATVAMLRGLKRSRNRADAGLKDSATGSMATRDVLVGIGIGALLLFIADPRTGRRRRALATDQFVRASRKTRDALDATAQDIANRTSGIVAAVRARWTDEPVDDRRLLERVRAKLGRACSHPRAIDVDVGDGAITLRGPILANEIDNVLATVRGVRGALSVTNALEPHESGEGVPALQGHGSIADPEPDILQRNWAPATQALVTAAGLAATAVCMVAYARR